MKDMNICIRIMSLALLVCAASFARAGFTSVAYLAGDTTLYASWSDTPGFNAADYQLRADGIRLDGDEVVIPFGAVNPGNLDYALEFLKVRSSPTLSIPTDAPETTATVETLESGAKALIVPCNPAAPCIDVGD